MFGISTKQPFHGTLTQRGEISIRLTYMASLCTKHAINVTDLTGLTIRRSAL
jgi:hypothetical protein